MAFRFFFVKKKKCSLKSLNSVRMNVSSHQISDCTAVSKHPMKIIVTLYMWMHRLFFLIAKRFEKLQRKNASRNLCI